MVRYSKRRISELFQTIDTTTDANIQGDALEELTCLLFLAIPGIKFGKKDFFNERKSQEIDIGFSNFNPYNGLNMIDPIIIVECKSSSEPLCSKDTAWFIDKIRRKHQKFGFLISLSGITGNPTKNNAAHDVIMQAFNQEGIMIFIIIREEILSLTDTKDFVELIQQKFSKLIFDEKIFYHA